MELKDFIKQTILDIATGIEEANTEAKSTKIDVVVNPSYIVKKGESGQYYKPDSQRSDIVSVEDIHFDVAVTTAGSVEGGAKGGINVFGAEFNAGGKAVDEQSNVSHIKFTIPVALPNGNK